MWYNIQCYMWYSIQCFLFFFPERFLEIVYHLWALNSRETQSMYYALQIGLLKDKAGEDSFFLQLM